MSLHVKSILLLDKLQTTFWIKRYLLVGRGYINYTFLMEGLIDELSSVIAPLVDENTTAVSTFERSDFLAEKVAVTLDLIKAKVFDENTLWFRHI